jgi:ankyrin repeat protein
MFSVSSDETPQRLEEALENSRKAVEVPKAIPGMQIHISDTLGRCEEMEAVLDALKEASIPSLSKALSEVSESLKNIEAAQQAEAEVRKGKDAVEAEEKQKKEILEWLSAEDFYARQWHVADVRQQGMSTWILETPKYDSWLESSSAQVLWHHGDPGSGKTVIFSAIVEDLLAMRREAKVGVAYIYFDFKQSSQQGPLRIFASLLKQLYLQGFNTMPGIRTCYKELCDECREPRRRPTMIDSINLLAKVSGLQRITFLCFDALDECLDRGRSAILDSLSKLCRLGNFKILVTSRENVTLRPYFNSYIEIKVRANDADLHTYLTAVMDSGHSRCLAGTDARSNKLRSEVIDTVISKANGMLLLAELQIQPIGEALNEREVCGLLGSLSEKINDQYIVYLDRIRRQAQGALALDVLTWIFGACRPMNAQELREALSVRDLDRELDSSGFTETDLLLDVTAGLVTFEKESDTFRLVHETLQDFLNENPSDIFPNYHLMISKTLLTYLSFNAFDLPAPQSVVPSLDLFAISVLIRSHQLLKYAFLNWPYHVDRGGPEALSIALRYVKAIHSTYFLRNMISEFGMLRLPFVDISGLTALHVSVLWDSREVTKALLKEDSTEHKLVNQPSDHGLTALHVAAMNDRFELTKLLIEQGANLESRDRSGRTPLFIAAACTSKQVFRLFLEKYWSECQLLIDLAYNEGLTVLHVLLRNGDAEGVKLLLKKSLSLCSLNATTKFGHTPLHYASLSATNAILPLLNAGRDINAKSSIEQTALRWASMKGNTKSIRLLLDHGADVNARDSWLKSPLHYVANAETQQPESIRLLLDKGVDINHQDIDGRTALHNVFERMHFHLATILLERGAGVRRDAIWPCQLSKGS